MGIVVAAVVVVGGIIYILFVLLSYYGDSARLAQELEAVRVRVDGCGRRLKDYENRVASLQDGIPEQKERMERIRRWIELLKGQKAQLESEQRDTRLMSHKERKVVVLKGLTDRRRPRQG